MEPVASNIETAAICGLYCKSCGIYIATKENNTADLKRIAQRLNIPVEQVSCNGCRSNMLSAHCKTCFFKACTETKGIEFCSECDSYPCPQLSNFKLQLPHRVELFKSLNRIKEVGWEKWYAEMTERHSCPKCKQVNGWYTSACSRCGNHPSSPFVDENFEILGKFMR